MTRCPLISKARGDAVGKAAIALCILTSFRRGWPPHDGYHGMRPSQPVRRRRYMRPGRGRPRRSRRREASDDGELKLWQHLKEIRATTANALDFQKMVEVIRDPTKLKFTVESLEGACEIAGSALDRLNSVLADLNDSNKCAALLVPPETGKAFRAEFFRRLGDVGISERDLSLVEDNDGLLENLPGARQFISELRGKTKSADEKKKANKAVGSEAERVASKIFASAKKDLEKQSRSGTDMDNAMRRNIAQQQGQLFAELMASASQLAPEYNALTEKLGLQSQKEKDAGLNFASAGFGSNPFAFGPPAPAAGFSASPLNNVSDEVKFAAGIVGHQSAAEFGDSNAFGVSAGGGISSIMNRRAAASNLLSGLLAINRKAYAILQQDWSAEGTTAALDSASARWIRDSLVQSLGRCYAGNAKAASAFALIVGDAASDILKCAVNEKDLARLDYAHLRRVRDAWFAVNANRQTEGKEQLEAFYKKSPQTIATAKIMRKVAEFISRPEKRLRIELDSNTNELTARQARDIAGDETDEATPVLPVASHDDL